MQKFIFAYTKISLCIYGSFPSHIRVLPRALWEKGLTSQVRSQPFNSKPICESEGAFVSAYAWEALLLAGSIALADPVKAYTCEVDVESGVVVLFADDPNRPVGEDHQFAID